MEDEGADFDALSAGCIAHDDYMPVDLGRIPLGASRWPGQVDDRAR